VRRGRRKCPRERPQETVSIASAGRLAGTRAIRRTGGLRSVLARLPACTGRAKPGPAGKPPAPKSARPPIRLYRSAPAAAVDGCGRLDARGVGEAGVWGLGGGAAGAGSDRRNSMTLTPALSLNGEGKLSKTSEVRRGAAQPLAWQRKRSKGRGSERTGFAASRRGLDRPSPGSG